MSAYYNEIDPYAAQWLRNLIADGLIAPGDVDTRSIEDVRPDDLRSYTQCHFFAGLGLWSLSLRRAGWPDERRIWTGSCPCQPFSSAGKGDGFDDERHLWPAFHHLIAQCGPETICGEQVASKDGYAWLDLVQTDMEGLGYAFWPVVLPVAGVGGPHERHRQFWLGLGISDSSGFHAGESPGAFLGYGDPPDPASRPCELVDSDQPGPQGRTALSERADQCAAGPGRVAGPAGPGPLNGSWRDADWLSCTDGRWRPVEPGTFPLAYGLPAGMGVLGPRLERLATLAGADAGSLKRANSYRIGTLRGYGNAIVPDAAVAFIQSWVGAAA